jgi:hypothetical protein
LTSVEHDALRRQFTTFAAACRGISPLYEMIAMSTAGDEDVTSLLAAAPPRERRASLLFAAVHYLLLKAPDHPLARFYPGLEGVSPDGDPTPAFVAFCRERRSDLIAIIGTRRAQPNEVQRSAVLLPALALASECLEESMTLVDVGCGAGLNLLFDRFRYRYGRLASVGAEESPVRLSCAIRGSKPPPVPEAMPTPVRRIGIDESPLDVTDPNDALWIRACIWPERTEAAAQVAGAIELARASPPQLISGHALEVLPQVLAGRPEDEPVCVMTSATLAYLDVDERTELAEVLRRLAEHRRLVWVTLEGFRYSPVTASEAAGRDPGTGCLGLTDFDRGRSEALALASMHGNWLKWIGPQGSAAAGADPPFYKCPRQESNLRTWFRKRHAVCV